ncbi:MAG TPA: hypothetical protein VMP68_12060 [Candidatus Eisenbacteria bacterium]|nr:hypothetical protein [Candidatus Eisenbacteria bacterium]
MTHRAQCTLSPADAARLSQLWSDHVDALERHLSVNTWALTAVTVVVMAYPIVRILVPAAFHNIVNIVPDVVRNVLHIV